MDSFFYCVGQITHLYCISSTSLARTIVILYLHVIILIISFSQELSLKGFWLQKWISSDKTDECREMTDYLLGLIREGKLKYE